jgi:hypothetical protein
MSPNSEDFVESALDRTMMLALYEDQFMRKPPSIAGTQPKVMAATVSTATAAQTEQYRIGKRVNDLLMIKILALSELRPAKRWQHY